MSELVGSVNDVTFDSDVLKSTIPVLVDFWAEWCGPCKMLTPLLDVIAKENEGRLKIVKLNVDENNATASQYGIMSIPSLLIFKDGKVIANKVGALTKSQLDDFINENC